MNCEAAAVGQRGTTCGSSSGSEPEYRRDDDEAKEQQQEHCQINLSSRSSLERNTRSHCGNRISPLVCRLGSEDPERRARDEMALEIEGVVDDARQIARFITSKSIRLSTLIEPRVMPRNLDFCRMRNASGRGCATAVLALGGFRSSACIIANLPGWRNRSPVITERSISIYRYRSSARIRYLISPEGDNRGGRT